ncbi:MAG: hypothetical protein ACKPKO_14600, partial [Candidatus Fonsibacter sp.]
FGRGPASEATKALLANRWPAGIKVFDNKSFLHAIARYDLSKSGGGQRNQITRGQCQSLEP